MKVQLGGGTDIAKAVAYAQGMVSTPTKTVVVLISDFYEGGSEHELIQRVKALCSEGVRFLGLAALDSAANPVYNHETGQALANVGAKVGAMTPGHLAAWLAEQVQA